MATLYDHRGQPISPSDLRRELADPETNRWLTPITDSVASVLTPEKLAGLMRAADEGDVAAYLTLAEEMEEREPQFRSVLSQRKFAVCSSEITVEAASEEAIDVEIADAVRELTTADPFEALLLDALDAINKGYSINEILWDTDGPNGWWWPRGYRWRDPRWFRFDPVTLTALRLEDGSVEGVPLAPAKFIVHHPALKSGLPARGGIARTIALLYVAKRYAAPQLSRFLEVMGVPARYARSNSTNESERISLLRELRRLGSDAAAVIPEGVEVMLLESKSGRGGPADIARALEYWDGQISKAVLGQTMTTDDGASKAQSTTHYSVKVDFTQHDNRQLSASINRDLVRNFVVFNFGPRPRYPRIRIKVEEREDLVAFTQAVTPFVDRGLEVDQRQIRERLGLNEPEPGAPLLVVPAPAIGPGDDENEPPKSTKAGGKGNDGDEDDDDDGHDRVDLRGRPGDTIAELMRDALAQDDRWRDVAANSLGKVLDAAKAATSFTELRELLEVLELDTDQLEEMLARVMFQARGLGDARDRA